MGGRAGWGPYLTLQQGYPTCGPSGFVMRQSVQGATYVFVKWGSNPGRGERLFSKSLGWLWGLPSLLFDWYWGFLLRG